MHAHVYTSVQLAMHSKVLLQCLLWVLSLLVYSRLLHAVMRFVVLSASLNGMDMIMFLCSESVSNPLWCTLTVTATVYASAVISHRIL
jgi:hypothetical protein